MLDPSNRSATVLSAVKTGAMTTSQWLAFATSGFKASAVSTASPSNLYIFQFPAMTGFLMIRLRLWVLVFGLWSWAFGLWSLVLDSSCFGPTRQRPKPKAQRPDSAFFIQRCHPRQFFAS